MKKKLFILAGIASLSLLASCSNAKDLAALDFTFDIPNKDSLIQVTNENCGGDVHEFLVQYKDKGPDADKLMEDYKSIAITAHYKETANKGSYIKSVTDFEEGNSYYYQRDYEIIDNEEIEKAKVETRIIRGEKSYVVITKFTFNEKEFTFTNSETSETKTAKISGTKKVYTSVPLGRITTEKYKESDENKNIDVKAHLYVASPILGTPREISNGFWEIYKSEDENTILMVDKGCTKLFVNGMASVYLNYPNKNTDIKFEFSDTPLVNKKYDLGTLKKYSLDEAGEYENKFVIPFAIILSENMDTTFGETRPIFKDTYSNTYEAFLSKYFTIEY